MAMSKRPPILLGPGVLQPLYGNAPLPSEQAAVYLKRLRYTVPFPVTPEQAYFGCMPEVVFRMHVEGMFDPNRKQTGKVGNLLSCLTRSPVTDDVSNIVHVSLGDYIPDVFWFETPQGFPSPLYRRAEAFTLPSDHPHGDALRKWAHACNMIEQGIGKALGTIMKVQETCQGSSAAWNFIWPDIMNFMKFRRMKSMPNSHRSHLKEVVNREVKAVDMVATTDLLSTCIMLPEKNPRLTAWVNFHSEEYNNGAT